MKLLLITLLLTFNLLHAKSSGHIEKGMNYEKARKILLNSGWKPLIMHPNSKCWKTYQDENVYSCKFKEIDDCSGTGLGYCQMWFYDNNHNFLSITTVEGEPPSSIINSWKKTTKKPKIY